MRTPIPDTPTASPRPRPGIPPETFPWSRGEVPLPAAPAREALVSRAADLVERPWDDARILLPGDDPAFRGTTFDDGRGMLEFHVDDESEVVRIFDIVWLE